MPRIPSFDTVVDDAPPSALRSQLPKRGDLGPKPTPPAGEPLGAPPGRRDELAAALERARRRASMVSAERPQVDLRAASERTLAPDDNATLLDIDREALMAEIRRAKHPTAPEPQIVSIPPPAPAAPTAPSPAPGREPQRRAPVPLDRRSTTPGPREDPKHLVVVEPSLDDVIMGYLTDDLKPKE